MIDVSTASCLLIVAFRSKNPNVIVEVNARIYYIMTKLIGWGTVQFFKKKHLDNSSLMNLASYLDEFIKDYKEIASEWAEASLSYSSEKIEFGLGFLQTCSYYIGDAYARGLYEDKIYSDKNNEIEKITTDLSAGSQYIEGEEANPFVFKMYGIILNLGAANLASVFLREYSSKPFLLDEDDIGGPKFASMISEIAEFLKNEKNWDPQFPHELETNRYAVGLIKACANYILMRCNEQDMDMEH